MFTTNFDKDTMPSLVWILHPTVVRTDWYGRTVFHYIAGTTSSMNKCALGRYYLELLRMSCALSLWMYAIYWTRSETDPYGKTPSRLERGTSGYKCRDRDGTWTPP
ncbi:Transcription factor mbp1 [Coniosporium apollinis]|uniref:Transcription factor mbp1 n=1 Tax=Coniosporium apollinis TaxID=61459 RepID=A0ABQ9NQR8_9PEZI|nr:Transcription factor mbp1 [Coniosporium apollinis]